MEQIYMIEILVDKVAIFVSDSDTDKNTDKNIIIKIKFGPKVQFIVKEGQMVKTQRREDIVACDTAGHRKWSRTIRVGKSYLFPSFPDQILMILNKFPLEIELWTDDKNEQDELIGLGSMHWDTDFFFMLKETTDTCKLHKPLSIKECTPLFLECCCRQVGEITFILRLSALGDSIITEFQQLIDKDPEMFVFRTNKAPSMFQCKRVDGDDSNYCMVGSLYETATLEDPDIIANATKKIEVCTELQSCGMAPADASASCQHLAADQKVPKEYAITKIRMGDITGPCGNSNCPLAHKIKTYMRNMSAYKKETANATLPDKNLQNKNRKVCGQCGCKDDRWHRSACEEITKKPVCPGCGGVAQTGETCEDRLKKMHGTGVTPKVTPKSSACKTTPAPSDKAASAASGKTTPAPSDKTTPAPSGKTTPATSGKTTPVTSGKTTPATSGKTTPAPSDKTSNPTVHYVTSLSRDPELMRSMFGQDFIVDSCEMSDIDDTDPPLDPEVIKSLFGQDFVVNPCITKNPKVTLPPLKTCACGYKGMTSGPSGGLGACNTSASEAAARPGVPKKALNPFCLEIPDDKDKECKCSPPKPTPPCKTLDCDCLTEAQNIDSRKRHKPFCPSYKHKLTCPVTTRNEDENPDEFEVEEAEPLPYGLPPIQLGPCPVLGRPCSVPDGFTRMYKTAVLPTQPPSYSDAGKVCCSKEYDRIKKAIKDYMQNKKEDDYRCINKFNVDTERRCCDKEQRLLALMGKDCCGSHKQAMTDFYKEKFAREENKRSKQ